MEKQQEDAFWEVIKAFDELRLLSHIMIIGSWAEYLYPSLFETDFLPNIRTRDVDFFYHNINIPNEKIEVIGKLKEIGFVHEMDPYSEVSKFYKEDFLELEFLTRALGSASKNTYDIRSLGIKSEGLKEINILADYAREVCVNGYRLFVPEPAAYVIQKVLTNPTRVPRSKREKDIVAVNEILVHIKQSDYHLNLLKDVYFSLSKKQLITVKNVVDEYLILFELRELLTEFQDAKTG